MPQARGAPHTRARSLASPRHRHRQSLRRRQAAADAISTCIYCICYVFTHLSRFGQPRAKLLPDSRHHYQIRATVTRFAPPLPDSRHRSLLDSRHRYQIRATVTRFTPPLPDSRHRYQIRATVTRFAPPLPDLRPRYQIRATVTRFAPPLPDSPHRYQIRATVTKFAPPLPYSRIHNLPIAMSPIPTLGVRLAHLC